MFSSLLTLRWLAIGATAMSTKNPYRVLRPQPNKIPKELRKLKQWIVWRLERRKLEGTVKEKATKVPYDPKTGRRASTKEPGTWSSFKHAMRAYRRDDYAGIGFIFSPDDPYCGIDLDNAVDADFNIKDWAAPYIDLFDSFAEISPSGTGVHVIVKGKMPGGGRKWGFNGHAIEAYDRHRYFAFTGFPLQPKGNNSGPPAIAERQEALSSFCRKIDRAKHKGQKTRAGRAVPRKWHPLRHRLSDDEIITLARSTQNGAKFGRLWDGSITGYPSKSEADAALCAMIAFYTGPNAERVDRIYRKSRLFRDKWDEMRGDETYGTRTIEFVLKDITDFYVPTANQQKSSGEL